MKKFAIAALVAGISLVSTAASAVQISGGFSVGNADGTNSPTFAGGFVTTNYTTPTSLIFNPGSPTNNTSSSTGGSLSGDFSTVLATAQFGSILDVTTAPTFGPAASFLTLGAGLTLDLTSLTITTVANSFSLFTGTGTINVTGFDPTPVTLSFSSQKSGASNDNTWSLSVTAAPQPTGVPEIDALAGTGALTLLGGALALAGERRRRKA